MKEIAITVLEKVIYVHDIIIEQNDDMDDLETKKIVEKVKNELNERHLSDVHDVVRLFEQHGLKVIETIESDDEWTTELEISDTNPVLEFAKNLLSRLNEEEKIALVRFFAHYNLR